MAKKLNDEFFNVAANNLSASQQNQPTIYNWTRLPISFLKINTDGAFSPTSQFAAIGIICRDNFGSFKWGFNDKIKSLSAFMTEALALKRAMLLAIDLAHDKVQFESDSQMLVRCIQL